jgi:hypothetical protein
LEKPPVLIALWEETGAPLFTLAIDFGGGAEALEAATDL